MTKRGTRLFFLVSTIGFAIVFLALTVDTERQFPTRTNADSLTAAVVAGEDVWHRKDCINCHTLLGEGAYYAPDLTDIVAQRGEPYLRLFLQNPSRFYSEEKDRRLMPNLRLSDQEITDVIAFLRWVGRFDTNGWPPRPILVTGSAPPAAPAPAPGGAAPSATPAQRGAAVFNSVGCAACHSTSPGVQLVGPSLAGVATRATQRIASPDYHGAAKDAAAYLHESIVSPSAYIVPGPTFSAGGQSLMPPTFAQTLTPAQIDDLVAYLSTLQ